MNAPLDEPFGQVDVNAALVADEAALATRRRSLLNDDEIVHLTLKPSLWYVAIASARVVAATAALAVALAIYVGNQWTTASATLFLGLIAAALLRVAVAALHWASRHYVLTNRRVLRCSGVFSVRIFDSPLIRISQIRLIHKPYHRPLSLATIQMRLTDDKRGEINWEHVVRPTDVYETLIRAVRRAQSE